MKTASKNLLKNKNFIKLWSSQLLSQLTVFMLNFILITQIYEATQSTIAVALLWVFYSLPTVFVGPFSGLIIDVISKRKIMILANFFQAMTIFGYLLTKQPVYPAYVAVFVYSFLNQFYLPAELASIPRLVNKKSLPTANSLFLLTSQASFLIGFGSGGILLIILGRNQAIFTTGIFLLLATVAAFLLPKDKPKESFSLKEASINLWVSKFADGWHFLTKKGKLVLYSFGFLALFQTIIGSMGAMFPAFSHQILGRSLKDTSFWLILPLSVGLIGGSSWFSRFASKKRKKLWIVRGTLLAGFSLLGIFLVRIWPTSFQFKFFFIIGLLLALGMAVALIFVPCQTFIQEATPQKIRGRIFGLMSVIISLSTIPPILFVAVIIDTLGITGFFFLLGLVMLLLSIFLSRKADEIILATNNRH